MYQILFQDPKGLFNYLRIIQAITVLPAVILYFPKSFQDTHHMFGVFQVQIQAQVFIWSMSQ